MTRVFRQTAKAGALAAGLALFAFSAFSQVPKEVDPNPKTYMKVVIEESFQSMMEKDVAQKAEVMKRQMELLERRYDLSDRPSKVMMSAGRKPIQEGVRVKLPEGLTWETLAAMPPEEIRKRSFSRGFLAPSACKARNRRPGFSGGPDQRNREDGAALP
jgi:hypothetical protein